MHKEACVSENTFFQARELRGVDNALQCLLADGANVVTTAQGKWLYPDGNPVNCSKKVNGLNPIGCSSTTNNNGATLYAFKGVATLPTEHNGVYTCCLPGNCSDGSSSAITVRIFSQLSLAIYEACFHIISF